MKDKEALKELSDRILLGMEDWRIAHPHATFREIEVKARELVSELEARLIQEMAMESEACDWAGQPKEARPTCPDCQVPLIARGRRKRKLQGTHGREIELERTGGEPAPSVREAFSP